MTDYEASKLLRNNIAELRNTIDKNTRNAYLLGSSWNPFKWDNFHTEQRKYEDTIKFYEECLEGLG